MKKYDVIVFQYGKVASTSLTAFFNEIPGVRAYQTHFLGRDVFIQMIDKLIEGSDNEFFRKHREGQLIQNIKIETIIDQYRKRKINDKELVFISIARDPINFFVSSVAQDIEGHLPTFRSVLEYRSINFDSEEDLINKFVPMMVKDFIRFIRLLGGVDEKLHHAEQFGNISNINESNIYEKYFQLFLVYRRPFHWYFSHFENYFGVRIASLEKDQSGIMSKHLGWARVYLVKYEDLASNIDTICTALGITEKPELLTLNQTRRKKRASFLKSAFQNADLSELRKVSTSQYMRYFEYETLAHI